MSINRWAVAALAAFALLVSPAGAFHGQGHQKATELAVEQVKGELPPFFAAGVATIRHLSEDPDIYRNAATPQLRDADGPDHYTKYESLKALDFPATRYAFIDGLAKKGAKLTDVGFVPYAVAEAEQKLALALAEYRQRPQDPAVRQKVLMHAGIMAHYAQDLCMPLHTTPDHDGRAAADGSVPKTGIHLKVDALLSKVAVTRDAAGKITAPPELAKIKPAPPADLMPALFARVKESFELVEPIYAMENDLPARDEPLKAGSKPEALAQERLAACVELTASLYLLAWQQSSKITLPAWLEQDRQYGQPAPSTPSTGSGQANTQPVADSARMVADAFERIHKRVAALKEQHPVLEGIANARPQFGGDSAFTSREALWGFANNATEWGKAQSPSAVDTSKPFCRIVMHMQTRSAPTDLSQPVAYARTYQIGGVAWEGYVKVWSDDAKLIEAVKAIVQEELVPATAGTTTATAPAGDVRPSGRTGVYHRPTEGTRQTAGTRHQA